MLTFFIGLFTGTLVGIAAMCLIVMGKANDRAEADAASRLQLPKLPN